MRGYEVIFKFPMISFKIPLESRFSRDPFIIFLIPPPPPYGYPTYLVSMERYFQAASGRGSFMARGSFFTKNVGIYRNTASNTYYQYPCFPPDITVGALASSAAPDLIDKREIDPLHTINAPSVPYFYTVHRVSSTFHIITHPLVIVSVEYTRKFGTYLLTLPHKCRHAKISVPCYVR